MKKHTFTIPLPGEAQRLGMVATITIQDPYVYDMDMIMSVKEALAHVYDCSVESVRCHEEPAEPVFGPTPNP